MVRVPTGIPVGEASRRRVVVLSIHVSSGIWGFAVFIVLSLLRLSLVSPFRVVVGSTVADIVANEVVLGTNDRGWIVSGDTMEDSPMR